MTSLATAVKHYIQTFLILSFRIMGEIMSSQALSFVSVITAYNNFDFNFTRHRSPGNFITFGYNALGLCDSSVLRIAYNIYDRTGYVIKADCNQMFCV